MLNCLDVVDNEGPLLSMPRMVADVMENLDDYALGMATIPAVCCQCTSLRLV
jgi:hypothetical protein